MRLAPFSFSSAARVARPKRVNVRIAQTTAPITSAQLAIQTKRYGRLPRLRKSSMDVFRPDVPGRKPGFSRASAPKLMLATDCRYSMMPTAPMTLPSAGAFRSGRNTSRWASRPMRQAISSASTAAGKSPMLSPKLMVTGMFGL